MTIKNAVYVPGYIREKSELASIYAEDGAYHSAARVLEDLAIYVRRHAEAVQPVREDALKAEGSE